MIDFDFSQTENLNQSQKCLKSRETRMKADSVALEKSLSQMQSSTQWMIRIIHLLLRLSLSNLILLRISSPLSKDIRSQELSTTSQSLTLKARGFALIFAASAVTVLVATQPGKHQKTLKNQHRNF